MTSSIGTADIGITNIGEDRSILNGQDASNSNGVYFSDVLDVLNDDDFPEVPAFKAGTHTDMNGITDDYPVEIIREIVRNYNPNDPAPVVIGHPETNSPAWAWIDKAREEGGKLLLKLREISPEFRQWVKEGKYKKVSVSLYPPDENGNGWRLRHLGYLGAMPPAVKGLPIPQYAGSEIYREFSSMNDDASTDEPIAQIEELNHGDTQSPQEAEGNGNTQSSQGIKETEGYGDTQATQATQVLEAEKMTTTNQTETPSTPQVDNNFAEQLAKHEQELAAKELALKQREEKFKRDRLDNFCEQLINAGKLLPAHKADQVEFMMSLDEDKSVNFAEGKKLNPLDYYQSFLKNIPQAVHFGEVAGVDSAPTQQQENQLESAYKKVASDYSEAWKATVSLGGK